MSAGAVSPYLQKGIGIAMLDEIGLQAEAKVTVGCIDGEYHDGELAQLPLYDKACEIPRGKLVDIPVRV